MVISDNLRQVLMKQPNAEAIEKAARAEGKTSLISEGYKLVLLGLTSIAEVQRVLKS
jgi:type II secretory ATPase GspE/PulE/Tfp pilus assembly ATPase PilB-like protein